jgi:asparagine synthase (glutamine-hydrolysing)
MLGIISARKEKLTEKRDLLFSDNIVLESFEFGLLSISSEEDRCFILKDDSNNNILIFLGELYIGCNSLNAKFNKENIAEIIFSQFSKKGINFLSELKGEFILGLWNEQAKRFILARDKLGARSIYYSVRDNLFVFCSKIGPFHKYSFTKKEILSEALSLYFSFKFVPSPQTIFKDIFKLAPGSLGIWEKDNFSTSKYWQVKIGRLERKTDLEDDVIEVESLINKSVQRRTWNDNNVCSYLSGGIDSSVIVGMLAQLNKGNISVFCANDEGRGEDVKCSKLVAHHFMVNYYEQAVSWPEVIKYLPEVIEILEEPMVDPSGVYIYLINKMAKNYGDKILSGEAGDELFGAYRWYYLANLADKFSFLYPKAPFDAAAKFSLSPTLRYRLMALRDAKNRAKSFLDIMGVFAKEDKDKLFTNRFKKSLGNDFDISIAEKYFNKDLDFMDLFMKIDIENSLPDYFLSRANKLAMSNSLSHSAPLLDEDLVEYAFKISKHNIFNILNKKIILKRLLERMKVAPGIIYRKKLPFVAPTGKWLTKGLSKWMKEILSYDNISEQGFFNTIQIEKIFKYAENDLRAQWQLWSLVIFTIWFKIFISNDDIS